MTTAAASPALTTGPVVDLHTHSTASDGTQPPAEVVARAAAEGLDVLALTDHDSTAGWDEAERAAREARVALVRGIELSCRFEGVSVHLLGYLMDPTDAALVAETTRTRDDRVWRAQRIVERVSADFPLTWEQVLAQVPEGATVGRPHIADAMVAAGHVRDRDEAFAGVLHSGSPYYVPHYAPDAAEAVRIIRRAGGAAVLAHALAGQRGEVLDDDQIRALAAAGLVGVEVDHRDHAAQARDHLRGLAAELRLLTTGSSDYHGDGKQNRLAENTTPPQMLEAIEAAASGVVPVVRP